jgi:membrane-associated protease RseP (regulator of RpoE activity)
VFLAEPPPTQFDLNFRLLGIPVRIHPFFWLVSLFMGSNQKDPKLVLIWVVAVFIAILVHEFGHALVARSFSWRPRIVLYSFGGLATYSPTHHDPRKQILIAFAGPGIGFVLAALIYLAFAATGQVTEYQFGWPYLVHVMVLSPHWPLLANILVNDILYVCVFWGLVNLLPVLPLDGGQICQEALLLSRQQSPTILALQISLVTAIGVAAWALLKLDSTYVAIFFGYLAFTNFQTLQMMSGRGGGRWL